MGLLGLGLGAFSVVGDTVPVLAAAANAVGPWIVVAFVAGVVAGRPRVGAAAGSGTLVLAVATYYVGGRLLWGDSFVDPVRASAVWGFVAVVIGAPLGMAGGTWAGGDDRWRAPSVALLSGLMLAEAITRFVEVGGWTGIDLGRTALQVWLYDTIVAITAPLLLLDQRHWGTAYVLAVFVGAIGAVALAVTMSFIRGSAVGA